MKSNPKQSNPADSDQGTHRLRVKFESAAALYAAQVMVNATPGEVFLNFSSGLMADQAGGDGVLPIHTRIAMTRETAGRLMKLIEQSLNARA